MPGAYIFMYIGKNILVLKKLLFSVSARKFALYLLGFYIHDHFGLFKKTSSADPKWLQDLNLKDLNLKNMC